MKPELIQSVLEISTDVCRNVGEAGGPARGAAPAGARDRRARRASRSRSAATHPFAHWEDQRIVKRERYQEIVEMLGFVARQELLFGLHVHVGIDDPDKAIHVANGMRVHIPILLALSTNSPFWRGRPTGLKSSRTPIFRLLPRVGIPARFENWAEYCSRLRVHGRSRRGAGLHVPVVGRTAPSEPGHGGAAFLRRADPARAHHRADSARPGDGEGAGRAPRAGDSSWLPFPPSCSTRTSGSQPATECRAT